MPTKKKAAKFMLPKMATRFMPPKVNSALTPKVIVHNKSFPIVKSSRTEMVKILGTVGGRFFTTTHVDKEGNPRTMNCIKSKGPASELGYIQVYSMQDKGYRQINPQTITDLSFKGTHYKVKK